MVLSLKRLAVDWMTGFRFLVAVGTSRSALGPS